MTVIKTKAKIPTQLKTFDEEKLNEEPIEWINYRTPHEYKKGYVGLYSYSDASAASVAKLEYVLIDFNMAE